jgi:hypothetical protein
VILWHDNVLLSLEFVLGLRVLLGEELLSF